MNPMLVVQILTMLPSLITNIESLLPGKAQGEKKLDVVLNAVLPLIPAEHLAEFSANVLPKIKMYVAVLVAMYNLTGFFKKYLGSDGAASPPG